MTERLQKFLAKAGLGSRRHCENLIKEKKVFDEDELIYQSIYRFEFDDSEILIDQTLLSADNFNKIAFSSDETKVDENTYGFTDQLYDAFTRSQ